jgi:hypothetical protein
MELLGNVDQTDRLVINDAAYIKEDAAKNAFMKFVGENFKELVQAYDQSQGIIRGDDGCYTIKNGYWGQTLIPAYDPLGQELEGKKEEKLVLKEGLPKIPSNLWAAWVHLCFHFVKNHSMGTLEVSCRILQNEEDNTQFKIIIPRQEVTAASTRSKNFEDSVDILTGEPIESYPIPGWRSYGSSHSHNTMVASPSSIDDKDELGDPGFHAIVGSINIKDMKYTVYTSITTNKTRYPIPINALIDVEKNEETFHPKVLDYVTIKTYTNKWSVSGTRNTKYLPGSYSQGTGQTTQNNSYSSRYSPWNDPYHGMDNEYEDYCDPFYWSNSPLGHSRFPSEGIYTPQDLEDACLLLETALEDSIEHGELDQLKMLEEFMHKFQDKIENLFEAAK